MISFGNTIEDIHVMALNMHSLCAITMIHSLAVSLYPNLLVTLRTNIHRSQHVLAKILIWESFHTSQSVSMSKFDHNYSVYIQSWNIFIEARGGSSKEEVNDTSKRLDPSNCSQRSFRYTSSISVISAQHHFQEVCTT